MSKIYVHGLHPLSAREGATYIVTESRRYGWLVSTAARGTVIDSVRTLSEVPAAVRRYQTSPFFNGN